MSSWGRATSTIHKQRYNGSISMKYMESKLRMSDCFLFPD